MSAQEFKTVILSISGATYSFMTRGYQPPTQERYIDTDVVKNQNGKFKYVYDNGPGFYQWAPFEIVCDNKFSGALGASAATQYTRLKQIWDNVGSFGFRSPEGTEYPVVHWAQSSHDRQFRVFPKKSADAIEYIVTVEFEEGS